jgi:olfactory receptor
MSAQNSLLQCFMLLWLSICRDVEIPHSSCEPKQVVHLACFDTLLNNMMMNFGAWFLGGGHLTSSLYSYSKIVPSILKFHQLRASTKHFPPVCLTSRCLFVLFCGTRSVPKLCCDPKSTLNYKSLSDLLWSPPC